MNTDDLIERLQADVVANPRPSPHGWPMIALLAIASGCLVLLSTIGLRPDFAEAVRTVRFDLKFVLTASLAVSALFVLRELSRPTGEKRTITVLLLPVLLVGLAVAGELIATPVDRWMPLMIGKNSTVCLITIPFLALVPLGLFLHASRKRAAVRPMLQGALCGLGAAAIGGFFYAARCTDDSPLFVALWYSLAAVIVSAIGALLGRRLLRW